ncbi:MAG: RnfABCDGE type electron transport complex subunit B [SAR324 cluster bacterium]|nr:RnfABCDGE type electron transport complex subunit B [SAR324 cluster bacterium]
MIADIVSAVVILGGLGLLFATILAIAYKKLHVDEDPRIGQVEDLLPGTNCGACGEPGCRAFAEQLVISASIPGACTVSSVEAVESIASFLGVDPGIVEKRVARLLCAGGRAEVKELVSYQGVQRTCRMVTVVTGGNKECTWGCLGLGDCADVCTFDAIAMNANGLPVVDIDQCTACGDCVEICPKQLFMIMPLSQKLIVQCRSLLEGETAEKICSVACNACGRCVVDSPPGLIEMRNNLPVIQYEKNEFARPDSAKRCPTKAIRWIDGFQFGNKASISFPLGRVDVSQSDQKL